MRKGIPIVLASLWALSLLLPTVATSTRSNDITPGWGILLLGWMGFIILQFGWFANLLLLPSLALGALRKTGRWPEIILGGIMVALTVNALFWRTMPDDRGNLPITHFGPGYYCWMIAVGGAGLWHLLLGFGVLARKEL